MNSFGVKGKRSGMTFRALYGTTSWLLALSLLFILPGLGQAETPASSTAKRKKRREEEPSSRNVGTTTAAAKTRWH